MSKKEIKEAGVGIGHAFKTFGKTFVRSAKTTADKVDDWANNKEPDENVEPNSTVYSDGSWKKTGKELGSAARSFGSALINTVSEKIDDNEENSNETENKSESNSQTEE